MKPFYYLTFVRKVLLLLVVSTNVFAQGAQTNYLQGLLDQAKKTSTAKTVPLFRVSNSVTYNASHFKAGQRPVTLTVDNNALSQIAAERPSLLEISIPTDLETIDLELVPIELFAAGSKLLLGTQNGTIEAPFQKGLYYQGFIKNKAKSLVSISIIEGEMAGFVSDESGNRVLSRLKQSPTNYLFYKDNTVAAQKEFICATDDSKANVQLKAAGPVESPGCKVVNIYFEADYKMYQDNGSNVTTTTNFITGVFNQVATIYNKENIAVRIAGIKIWTTTDPYATATTSNESLNLFVNYQNANPPPGVSHQLAHLLSTKGLGGGIAYLDVLCNAFYKYAVSGNLSTSYADFPNYSWEVMVISHEMGHNFGSPHTQSCSWVGGALDNCYTTEGGCPPGPAPVNGGTIMSYCHLSSVGINLANGFGQQPGDLLRNRTAAASCVPAATGVPTDLAVKNIRPTSVTTYWVSNSGSTSFTLQYRPASSGTWTTVGPFLGPQYTLTGLQPNTAYVWKVTGDCAGAYSAEATFNTGQPAYCTPTYFNNGCSFDIGLKSVTLNGTALTSNSGCAPTYFTYYPTPVGSVSKDNPNPFTIEFLGYYNAQQVTIWIDFNENYEFEASEKVFATTTGYQVPVSGNLTIPSTAPTGVTRRMRVRNQFSSPVNDACVPLGYGETEDYLVTIQGGCETPSAPTASGTTICSGTTATLSAAGCSGGTIKWYGAPSGGTPLATTSSWTTPALTTATNYYVSCTQGTCESARTTVTVTVNASPAIPNITATADSVACQGQSVTLVVTNCNGSLSWQPGGATGNTLVVNPTVRTTYTATCTANGCSSSNSITLAPVSTMYSKQTGNWNDPAVWSCNRVPIASDVLTIRPTHIVTMPASYTGAAKSMSVLGRINYQTNAKILLGQ